MGERAEKDESCEAQGGENAGIAWSVVEGLRDHGFRRHRDERAGSVSHQDGCYARTEITQEVESQRSRRRRPERDSTPQD